MRAHDAVPADVLLARLPGARPTGPQTWRAPCIVCGTKSLKVSVRELDDGRVLLHAFCGHDVAEIVTALGLTLSDLFPPRADKHRYPPSRLRMATSSDDSFRWRDRVAIAQHEITCVCIIAADILDQRGTTEPDWQRLTLALQRLRALSEVR